MPDLSKRYLIHDRDPLFTDEFLRTLKDADVESVKLPPFVGEDLARGIFIEPSCRTRTMEQCPWYTVRKCAVLVRISPVGTQSC